MNFRFSDKNFKITLLLNYFAFLVNAIVPILSIPLYLKIIGLED